MSNKKDGHSYDVEIIYRGEEARKRGLKNFDRKTISVIATNREQAGRRAVRKIGGQVASVNMTG